MPLPTQDEIEQALHDHATQRSDGYWSFNGGPPHSEASALAIVMACLTLGAPVTDLVSAQTWLRLLERVVQLEERIERLERR